MPFAIDYWRGAYDLTLDVLEHFSSALLLVLPWFPFQPVHVREHLHYPLIGLDALVVGGTKQFRLNLCAELSRPVIVLNHESAAHGDQTTDKRGS